MPLFGFSTGALALGDFQRALRLLRGVDADAVELSALRETELPVLMEAAGDLELDQFEYVSVHAPSRLSEMTEAEASRLLLPCVDRGWNVVLHPDVVRDFGCWRPFGRRLCIENMDKRKATGRIVGELRPFLQELPDASVCLDLAHARQIDTTFSVARAIAAEYGGDRLAQIHLSELDSRCHHSPLSRGMVTAVQQVRHWMRPVPPVILESQVSPAGIREELRLAREAFGEIQPPARREAGIPATA
jgi:hypothetical protein